MTNHHISVPKVDLILAMDDLRLSGRDYSADLLNKALFSASESAEPACISLGARTLGNYGAAYDPPGKHRAYTYEHQPGNAEASRIGRACLYAATASAGDTIDRGLGLLKELQEQGFGVFDVEASRWHAAPVAAQNQQSVNSADQVRIQDSGSPGWLDGIQCQYSIVRGDPYLNGETLAYVFEKEIADRIVEALNAASPKLSKDSVQRRAVLSEGQISAAAQCLKAEVREDKGDIVLSNVDCFIRALEQDVLRKAASQHTATLAHIKAFVACDASAISYLTLGEYRTALLKILNEAKANE